MVWSLINYHAHVALYSNLPPADKPFWIISPPSFKIALSQAVIPYAFTLKCHHTSSSSQFVVSSESAGMLYKLRHSQYHVRLVLLLNIYLSLHKPQNNAEVIQDSGAKQGRKVLYKVGTMQKHNADFISRLVLAIPKSRTTATQEQARSQRRQWARLLG